MNYDHTEGYIEHTTYGVQVPCYCLGYHILRFNPPFVGGSARPYVSGGEKEKRQRMRGLLSGGYYVLVVPVAADREAPSPAPPRVGRDQQEAWGGG